KIRDRENSEQVSIEIASSRGAARNGIDDFSYGVLRGWTMREAWTSLNSKDGEQVTGG
ncbi:hypothetical protein HN011_005212, partial [Eciton burchellii]